GHVQTLWKLLEHYKIPTFLFVNKMDQISVDKHIILQEIKTRLSDSCVEFIEENGVLQSATQEEIATSSEELIEVYLDRGELTVDEVQRVIEQRLVFPVFLGSALKLEGVEELMLGIGTYGREREYPTDFGGKIYKILRDEQGTRLSCMKVTGGELRIKDKVVTTTDSEGRVQEEKVEQIRIYSGGKFEKVQRVRAGDVCAIVGFQYTKAGQGIGYEQEMQTTFLESILTYQIGIPQEVNPYAFYLQLQELQEEQPCLGIAWNAEIEEIQVSVMGEIQIEVLTAVIHQRYGVEVEFLDERIVYKETIKETVVGIGHYEPLKHYAEVHVRIERGESGTGVVIQCDCNEEVLSKNRQNLVCTHLKEKLHKGVLVGGELTDVILTVIAGREHPKHTEGGDFREATYRAVRQGLLMASCELLEPIYAFRLEIPTIYIGKAMYDIQQMYGSVELQESDEEHSILKGMAPLVRIRGYQRIVADYTKGMGVFDGYLQGYGTCHNPEEVIEDYKYEPNEDLDHTGNSIFCANGSGYMVPWNEVYQKAHVPHSYLGRKRGREEKEKGKPTLRNTQMITNDEIKDIFQKLYPTGSRKPQHIRTKKIIANEVEYSTKKTETFQKKEEYLLVDGYNIIFAWKELKELAEVTIDGARDRLIEIMSNYNGYCEITIVIVFDAYKVKGNLGSSENYHNVHVVYTKEAQTADTYIERTVHQLKGKYKITVATSDALEQLIVMGQGALRMSAKNLLDEVRRIQKEIGEQYLV
ncbi:MAG: NYN domain-containing protein, partial [Eubacteriales bacterium]